LPLLAVPSIRVGTQPQSTALPDELFGTIASLDNARCDSFGTFLLDDVEFYHDRGDLRQAEPDRKRKEKDLRERAQVSQRAKRSSFTSGKTKIAHGRSRE
jgi:hypothetical protein